MRTRTLEITAESAAPPEHVWALLADVDTWSQWGAFDESKLERPGDTEPDGVGAIRRFRVGRTKNTEEVVRFEPARTFSYEVRKSDIPMRDYRSDVILTPTREGGTAITWRPTFTARWPLGPIIQRQLHSFIADTAERLATAAQQRAARAKS